MATNQRVRLSQSEIHGYSRAEGPRVEYLYPNELAETFNSHFAGIGENLARDIPHVNIAPEDYVEQTDKNFSLSQIGKTEVHKLINQLENNKLLKLAVDIISPSLTCIFNRSIESGVFLDEWKSARVTPIFKKGVKTDPGNYRPISVSPVVAKIFEKAVYNQFYKISERQQITV